MATNTSASVMNRHQNDCASLAPLHQYRTHIYFISTSDKDGDGIPTLKRKELGAGGFSVVPLVEGIDDLQIEYGIDNPNAPTGAPMVFTSNPDGYNACLAVTSNITPAPVNPKCTTYWRNIVAVKVYVLARNISKTIGYSSDKTYTLGLKSNGNAYVVGSFSDGFKRHAYQTTIRINNVALRNGS
jgi:type IV pilus assembly protein PilW